MDGFFFFPRFWRRFILEDIPPNKIDEFLHWDPEKKKKVIRTSDDYIVKILPLRFFFRLDSIPARRKPQREHFLPSFLFLGNFHHPIPIAQNKRRTKTIPKEGRPIKLIQNILFFNFCS